MTVDTKLLVKALDSTNDGTIITTANEGDKEIIYANPAFERLTGYTQDEILGRDCRFLQGNDRKQAPLVAVRKAVGRVKSCRITLRNYRKDGQLFWNELSLAPIFDDDGKLTNFVGVQKDVSKEVDYRNKINYMATHDLTTDLYNNRGFYEQYHQLVSEAPKDSRLYVALLDVDRFKKINDQFGHAVGDEVLKAFAKNLVSTFNNAIVARMGSDEFVVSGADSAMSEGLFKSFLARAIKLTQALIFKEIQFSVSVGIVFVESDKWLEIDNHLRHADQKMYSFKVARECTEV